MWQKKISGARRNGYALAFISLFAVAVGVATASGLQVSDAQVVQPSGHATNLKVLSKETSINDVYKLMAKMQTDLGVQCGFCHEEDPDSKRIDYASDENPRKETARFMMRMTQEINEKYLGRLGDRQYAPPITCGNCHLGQMHPPPFTPAASK
jgi:hypothetical protein